MRRLRVALAVCALAAAPAALPAQQTTTQQQPPAPKVNPSKPTTPAHPHPAPSGAYSYHNHGSHGNPYANGYPLLIDGSVINRVLATPSPKPKHTPAARTSNGEQVFETHSTDDAR
jgi:hypothetical protein